MFYKRSESFRYTFGTPPEIRLRIMDTIHKQFLSPNIYGLLLDISPKGAKVFSEKEWVMGEENVSLEFVLNHETITAEATIVWKQQYEEGWLYGIDFNQNSIKEMLILSEIRELKEIEMN
ncbi:PilZ domain-containing protein [Planococcus sp. CPCC 101016]|uniref:PilZ domain-containing protein n=1 Tax=Planococcus sp. CPCC 101016 TaxID=2599617 RepID=UPI0011B6F8DB|nr:PilZ domain-containing protein [Planococcus sp. CPCC 101016]TWT07257.1 PilZ domain-containing protein [Planococcus sp. CPCC 101016]